jgi:hypothetical protein
MLRLPQNISLFLVLFALCVGDVPAVDVTVEPPLVARIARSVSTAPAVISATIQVPEYAPEDLGYGIFVTTWDGLWWQTPQAKPLSPGTHHLRCLVDVARLSSEGHTGPMDSSRLASIRSAGFFFWTSQKNCVLQCSDVSVEGQAEISRDAPRILPRPHPVFAGTPLETGKPWHYEVDMIPAPENPYDTNAVRIELILDDKHGNRRRIPAFWYEPQSIVDRGDSEMLTPTGKGRYALRWWPRQAGEFLATLEAWTPQSGTRSHHMGTIQVVGESWDPYVRRDQMDPRFFSIGTNDKKLFWPIGINIRSITDPRSTTTLNTKETPNRIIAGYESYFARFQAAGINACEIWMASWNVGLEWNAKWPGYHGIGRYNQENALRLDQVLDSAWRHGIRVQLVISNHGTASPKVDREWLLCNPWNQAYGGPCAKPEEIFTHPLALDGQERLRRYIVARYGYHPAIWGWKLWSEMNLTAANAVLRESWMRQATQRWVALDPVGRGTTCHWCPDYKAADPGVCRLANLGYISLDAYRKETIPLTDLLWNSTNDPRRGLSLIRDENNTVKPVFVAEYGGNTMAGSIPLLLADHCSGPWISLVSGHGASSMLWWWEWVDQGNLWAVYRGIHRFLEGEDLRSTPTSLASSVLLQTESATPMWCGVWYRPGRILGYVVDTAFPQTLENPQREQVRIVVSTRADMAAGTMTLQWFDPLVGVPHSQETFKHPGGPLTITAPPFRRHIAFKLFR